MVIFVLDICRITPRKASDSDSLRRGSDPVSVVPVVKVQEPVPYSNREKETSSEDEQRYKQAVCV